MNHSNLYSSKKTELQTQAAANDKVGLNAKANSIKTAKPVNNESSKESFYDFYLAEHNNINCRRLHFAGSSFGLLGIAISIKTRSANHY